jgi:threonylcarbamoyladenosine tRNA methylthiotransferase MtaB
MKIAFHTLGCKVNQHDTQSIAGLFRAAGHEIVPFEAGADVYVINTCAVTKVSEQKSRQIIRKGIDYNPEAIVVVTGCYAQTAPQEIAGLPGVNLVVGVADRPKLVELVAEFSENYRNQIKVTATQEIRGWQEIPVIDSLDRTRATLKVQDGCEQFCAYCIIPYARGKVRSMPILQAIEAYSDLVSRGFREIVLTGIHLGQYGKDLGIHFHDLLAELLKIDSSCRVRLGSLEPKDITPQLLELVINNPKVCQHLHIPLQSGSDHILERMTRNYDLAYYADLVTQIRKQNPLLAIGTDLIVGFPGESELDFDNTCSFLQAQNFSRVHVFRFSPRLGTPAASFPDRVAKGIQEERSRIIQKIADNSACHYAGQFINRNVEVLFEEKEAGAWNGLSGEYLRVTTSAEHDLKNALRMVRIQNQKNDNLIGSLIDS